MVLADFQLNPSEVIFLDDVLEKVHSAEAALICSPTIYLPFPQA
jgi:hypothetical protein